MVRFRTLTQRFGVLYAVTAAILAGVIAVVTIHLGGIRLDSKRLLEEAREQTVTAQLIAQVEALSALVEQSSSAGEREVARAREMLRSTLAELLALEGGPNDPSREEHQEAETRVADRLAADLELADRLLAARATPSGERAELLGLLGVFLGIAAANAIMGLVAGVYARRELMGLEEKLERESLAPAAAK